MNAKEKINDVIVEKLSVELKDIVPEAHFIDDLGADSLDIVELIMSLEEMADLDIADEDAEKLETVQSVYDYIKSQVGEDKWNQFEG